MPSTRTGRRARSCLCAVVLMSLARGQEDAVLPTECKASTITGYDFQVEPKAGYVMHWSLSPDLESISFRAIVAAELPGWVALGFSSDGNMIGSDAVVAFPSGAQVTEYDLDSKIAIMNEASPLQETTNTMIEKANGSTSLAFTRPASPEGEGKLSLLTDVGALTIMIWAFGPTETFGYHYDEGRGSFSVDLFCSNSSGGQDGTGATGSLSPTGSPLTEAPTPAGADLVTSASPTALGTTSSPREEESSGASFVGLSPPSTVELLGLLYFLAAVVHMLG